MTLLADRYELGEELGAGGMARVVAAHDRRLDRSVAIKLLGSAADATSRERLVREARSAARFQHPNAVTVHDAGEHDGQPYIVMERVDGRTLADRLRDDGPLAAEAAVVVVAGVLDALAAAHADGLVHRDVKPANVLLPDAGGVKLADFGIAKALDEATSGLTATGTVIGTPSYLAPELVQGNAPTPASDVYSVGCVLYELLVGRPPFPGDTPVRVAYAHAHEPAPRVDETRPDVPAHVRATLDRALAKDPGDRFVDAAAMRDALDGRAPVTSPPTVPLAGAASEEADATATASELDTEPRRWRRWPVVAAGTIAVLLLGAALFALADGRGAPDEAAEDTPATDDTDTDADTSATADPPPDDPPPDTSEDTAPITPADEPDDTPADGQDGGTPADEPADLAELLRFLSAAEPGTHGEKQADLRDDLLEVQAETDPDVRAEEARDLLDDLADWVADGELDGDLAAITREVLADVVAGG